MKIAKRDFSYKHFFLLLLIFKPSASFLLFLLCTAIGIGFYFDQLITIYLTNLLGWFAVQQYYAGGKNKISLCCVAYSNFSLLPPPVFTMA